MTEKIETLTEKVLGLITAPYYIGETSLNEWLEDGDIEGKTPEQLARDWDAEYAEWAGLQQENERE